MLACCNFLPRSCAPVAIHFGSFKDQDYSLALPQSVYFSLIRIQCLLVSKAADLQIQGIWCRVPSKPDATDKHNTSLYSVPEQQQERNLEDTCVPSVFDEFLHISFPCAMWCKLGDPDSTAKAGKNSNLKITPSERHTVGNRVVQNLFITFQLNFILWSKWYVAG